MIARVPNAVASTRERNISSGRVERLSPTKSPERSVSPSGERFPFHQFRAMSPDSPGRSASIFSERRAMTEIPRSPASRFTSSGAQFSANHANASPTQPRPAS